MEYYNFVKRTAEGKIEVSHLNKCVLYYKNAVLFHVQ